MLYSPNKTLHGNFKMYEVAKSSTADRLGIINIPSDKVLEVAEQACIHILQPVRDEFGPMSPGSWYRCEELERVLTKTSFSNFCRNNGYSITRDYDEAWVEYFALKSHPRGEGIDFEKSGIDNRVMFNWCKLNLPEYDQLIAEFMKADDPNAGWIHGSYSAENNRNQLREIK